MNVPRLLDRVVRVGLLAVVALAPCQYSLELAPKAYLSPVDPVVWLVLGAWALNVVLTRAWRTVLAPPWPALLFLTATAASIGGAGDRVAVLKDLFQYIEYFVAAWLLFAWAARDGAQFHRRVTTAFAAVTTGICLLAAAQYLTPGRPTLAVGGTFGNRNVLGGYLALSLPLLLSLGLHEPGLPRRAWLLATVLLGFLVNLSGGSFMALIAALPWTAALRGRRALAAVAIALAAMTLAVLPRLPRANPAVLVESVRPYGDDGQPSSRYPEWQAAAAMAAAHPWLGVGSGNYQRNVGMFYGTVPCPVHAAEPDTQNLYLVLGSSLGLPGLAAFIALLALGAGTAVVRGAQAAGPCQRAAAFGAAGSLAAFALNAVWSPLLVRGLGIPLAIVLATAFCSEDSSVRKESERLRGS